MCFISYKKWVQREKVYKLHMSIFILIFSCILFHLKGGISVGLCKIMALTKMCIYLINQGSLFVVESFIEYFQASWQGLGTSQVVFLLVEAVGMPTLSYFLGLNNFDILKTNLCKMRFIQIIMKVLQIVRVPAMGNLLAVFFIL